MRFSERSNPVAYQATLAHSALRAGVNHTASDADLDQAAIEAGLRPAARDQTREAVRDALESPVDFADTSAKDASFALFNTADTGRPLLVVGADGRRFVLEPYPVEASV
ncbi:hypothetical protein [Streptomyces sasae]|uniref:hypothetical protein n=1 Tax=Streptomyces sasae TaxID=1266772 RepID=UPI00292CEB31|nr:hypothetical protein [Streptomyces sasae]